MKSHEPLYKPEGDVSNRRGRGLVFTESGAYLRSQTTLVPKRFSINGKINTGSALGNHVTKGPESVIPAQAGIQAIELNDKNTGYPPSGLRGMPSRA
jgi:hypothetical protein